MNIKPVGKRKLFNTWILSYIVIIAVSIMINMFVYIQSVKAIEEDINNSYTAMLKQFQQTIDAKLREIEKLRYTIMLDKNTGVQASLSEPVPPMYRTRMLDVIKTLSTCKVANNNISDIFIYFKKRGMIVSDRGTCGDTQYFDIYYPGEIDDMDKWMAFLQARHENEFYSPKRLEEISANMEDVIFLQTIPYDFMDRAYATLVIVFGKSFFENSMSSFNMISQGGTMIVDKHNDSIIDNNRSDIYNLKDVVLNNEQGILENKTSGNGTVVLYIRSDVLEWKYVTIFPQDVYAKKASDIKHTIAICVILCLMLGIIAAYVLSLKNYKPVVKILRLFSNKGKIAYDKRINEFTFIENSLIQVLKNSENSIRIIEKQKTALKNSSLSRLLKGNIRDALAINDLCRTYGIEFKGDCYLVVMLYIESYGNLFSGKSPDDDEEEIALVHFVVCNILEELLSSKYYCQMTEVDQAIACIVNTGRASSEDHTAIQAELINCMSAASKVISENFAITFSASISDIHNTINEIPAAYKECIEVLEYKMVIGVKNIMCYNELNIIGKKTFINAYPLETQQKFINCIKANDFPAAIQVIESVFSNNFSGGDISLEMARILIFAMVNTMINAINEVSSASDLKFLENLNFVKRILRCKSIQEMRKQIEDVLLAVGDYYNKKLERNDADKIGEIKLYIEKNYYDCNLSVSAIASRFGMNPAYFSKYFKEHTGEGVLYTINRMRLERAKVLLNDKSANVKGVSRKVGFYNSIGFIRTFKKYEGITPGKYREIYCK